MVARYNKKYMIGKTALTSELSQCVDVVERLVEIEHMLERFGLAKECRRLRLLVVDTAHSLVEQFKND